MTSALCHLWHKRELNTCLASISVNIISSSCSIRSLKCIRQEIHRRNRFVMSHCLELSFECMSLCRCMEICHKQDRVFFFKSSNEKYEEGRKIVWTCISALLRLQILHHGTSTSSLSDIKDTDCRLLHRLSLNITMIFWLKVSAWWVTKSQSKMHELAGSASFSLLQLKQAVIHFVWNDQHAKQNPVVCHL